MTSQFITSILGISALEMTHLLHPGGEENESKQDIGLGIFTTSFRHFTQAQARAYSLTFAFLLEDDLNSLTSAPIFSTGCPDYEWVLPHCSWWSPDNPPGGLCAYLCNCVVPSLGRHYGE